MGTAASAALFFLIAGANAQSARPLPPVEAFGSLPFISDARLSPDGLHFAAIQELNGRPVVAIYRVNAPKDAPPHVYQDAHWIIAGISWAKNDRLIIFVKNEKYESTWYFGISVSAEDDPPITLQFDFSDSTVVDKDLADPNYIFLPGWNGETVDLFRVNVHTGRLDDMQHGRRFMARWILDGHGEVVGRVDRLHEPLY
jgi:hypothetical protein